MRVNVESLAGRRIFHVGSRRDGLVEASRLRMGNKNRSAIPESSDLKFHKSDSVAWPLYNVQGTEGCQTKRNETQWESQDATTSCKQVNKWWEWLAATTTRTFTADPMVRWWRRVRRDPRSRPTDLPTRFHENRSPSSLLEPSFIAFIQPIAPRATLRIVRRRVC